ncbi:hypothetical protein [Streptomyces sp. NPDC054887]
MPIHEKASGNHDDLHTDPVTPHAQHLIRAFILRPRRDRLSQLTSPRKRQKLSRELPHNICAHLDEQWARPLAPHEQNVTAVRAVLRTAGAPATAVVISRSSSETGEKPLQEALETTVGHSYGAFVSCIPGVLAYYESEDSHRFLLHRPPT